MDGLGRVLSVETAEGGREEYAYDCAGNVIKSTDANGNTIRYAYNSQGKVCSIIDQSGNTETFRYDKEGREIQHTDRNGTVTETKYNVYGKPVLQICTDNKGNRQIMGTWEYDSLGQLKKSVSGGFCYTYEYRPDGNSWINGVAAGKCFPVPTIGTGAWKVRPIWAGRLCFSDGDGRLKCLRESDEGTSGSKTAVTGGSIADEGRIAGKGTILTEYRYTDAGRIKEITTKGSIRTSYTYDEDGNISRLTNEDRNGVGERYAYDLCGNRLLKEQYSGSCVDGTEGYRYNERNELEERVKAGSLSTCRYDKNGSIISEEEEGRRSEYRYDLLNRQIYVKTLDGKEQENFYDGESAPIRRHIRGTGLSCVRTLVRLKHREIKL